MVRTTSHCRRTTASSARQRPPKRRNWSACREVSSCCWFLKCMQRKEALIILVSVNTQPAPRPRTDGLRRGRDTVRSIVRVAWAWGSHVRTTGEARKALLWHRRAENRTLIPCLYSISTGGAGIMQQGLNGEEHSGPRLTCQHQHQDLSCAKHTLLITNRRPLAPKRTASLSRALITIFLPAWQLSLSKTTHQIAPGERFKARKGDSNTNTPHFRRWWLRPPGTRNESGDGHIWRQRCE